MGVSIEDVRVYLEAVAEDVISRSDLKISYYPSNDNAVRIVLESDKGILVWLLWENGEFSIEIENLLSGAAYYAWPVKEMTPVVEAANWVIRVYDEFLKARNNLVSSDV